MRPGESGWGMVEIVTGSVSFMFVITRQLKVFVEGGQAERTKDRMLRASSLGAES